MSVVGRKLSLEFNQVGKHQQLALVKFCASYDDTEHSYRPSDAGGWGSALMGFALLLLEFKLDSASLSQDFLLEVPKGQKSPLSSLAEELEQKSWIWRIFAKPEKQDVGVAMIKKLFKPSRGDYRHGKADKTRKLRIRGSELLKKQVTITSLSKAVTGTTALKKLIEGINQDWRSSHLSSSDRSSSLTPLENKRATSETAPFFQSGSSLKVLGDEIDLPDLITPGSSRAVIEASYKSLVGSERARKLADCWDASVKAVADGDFSAQETTGRTLAQIAEDVPRIKGVGLYLAGEGVRLQGDLARDHATRTRLYQQAAGLYQEAGSLTPGDPRSFRGLARIDEHEGRLDHALVGFENAETLLHATVALRKGADKVPFVAHEHLRILRHKIHCILHERESSSANAWNTVQRSVELEGMVANCERLHVELMPIFVTQPKWFQIEWFMGLVFLAKAYAALRHPDLMVQKLLHALSARRTMFNAGQPLSVVDYANLEWWCSVAASSPIGPSREFAGLVERLQEALQKKQPEVIIANVDALLRSALSPWESSR